MTIEEIKKLPVGSILILSALEIKVILGEEDYEEFLEYSGRWITRIWEDSEEYDSRLASDDQCLLSYEDLTIFDLITSN